MRVHWEKLGILGPVYRLVGRGFANDEIADQLNVSEDNVRRCVAWLIRFGGHGSRGELVIEAFEAIPRDGEHRIAPVMLEAHSVSGGLCQVPDLGKSLRVADVIQAGTMLMRQGFLLPDSANIGTLDFSATWRVLDKMNSSNLSQRLSLSGLHLFFIAGEMKVLQLGWGPEARRRGIRRILALSRKEYLNCTEITQLTEAHFLGVPYVAILAHSFHIQKGILLQSRAERMLEQQQRDWACG